MRLICILNDPGQSYALSAFLAKEGIENQLEVVTNTDWGSPGYGTIQGKIWAYDEERYEEALKLANEFIKDPSNPRFMTTSIPPLTPTEPEPVLREQQPIGTITLYLLVICTLLLIIAHLTTPPIPITHLPENIPVSPFVTAPVYKEMMYDYPKAYMIIDQIIATFGMESFEDLNKLPPEGQALLEQFKHTPYWQGLYDKIVRHFKHPEASWGFDAPLFEKIREGEVWRVITPVLLHSDILHLLFNMLWLVVLGKQMEHRMRKKRYILFIILTGIFSNTAQYLMSGAGFLGFSGVLCAMLAFIWIRQKHTAWEGYTIERSTFAFIAFFILFMVGIQTLSFILEISGHTSFPVGIANTAHLSGALSGYLLGKTNLFAWRT